MGDADAWDAYRAAVLRFGEPATLELPVERRWSSPDQEGLLRLGLTGPFAVVTACHPHPARLSAAENHGRHLALLAEVQRQRWSWVPCAGSSPDGSHSEEGLAVVCSREDAIELARSFGQAAIYWWDTTSLWLEPVHSSRGRERLTSPAFDADPEPR